MYVSPVLSKTKSDTPKEYTNRARDEITRKLNIKPPSSQLRHGSSPLKNVSSASDHSLSKTSSSDSLELPLTLSEKPEAPIKESKAKSKLFGLSKLRHLSSNNSSSSSLKSQQSSRRSSQDDELPQHEHLDEDVQMEDYEYQQQLPPLHPVPSISSSFSSASSMSTTPSVASKVTAQDSLFSNKTLQTQYTNISQFSEPDSIQQQSGNSHQRIMVTLQNALPSNFQDMYAPELLADPSLLIDGRPMFTKRALLDWELNDIRSLLIVDSIKLEWNNDLPIVYSPPGFKFEFLPLDADDETIVKVLVESDIYKEAKFDREFREQTAKYTLNAARSRHAMFLQNSGIPIFYNNRLSKPEWRNVIENFLLNLAVEAQCRYDFKKSCHEMKKMKKSGMIGPDQIRTNGGVGSQGNSLLRKALMNDSKTSGAPGLPKLSKEEKAKLWTQVQAKVYKRIGLDWTPDTL